MSLEAAINENTAAIQELIDTLKGSYNPRSAPAKPAPKEKEAAPIDEADYETAKKAFLGYIKDHGRDKALALLNEVQKGAQKLPDIRPELLAEIVERCTAETA